MASRAVFLRRLVTTTSRRARKPAAEDKLAAIRAAEARDAALRAARTRRTAGLSDAQRQRRRDEEYQRQYRRLKVVWVARMVAIPFLIVTSYLLYLRLVKGEDAKALPKTKEEWERWRAELDAAELVKGYPRDSREPTPKLQEGDNKLKEGNTKLPEGNTKLQESNT